MRACWEEGRRPGKMYRSRSEKRMQEGNSGASRYIGLRGWGKAFDVGTATAAAGATPALQRGQTL